MKYVDDYQISAFIMSLLQKLLEGSDIYKNTNCD